MYDDDILQFEDWHSRRYRRARNRINNPERADDMVIRLTALLLTFGAPSVRHALVLAHQVVADDINYLEGEGDGPVEVEPFDQDCDYLGPF